MSDKARIQALIAQLEQMVRDMRKWAVEASTPEARDAWTFLANRISVAIQNRDSYRMRLLLEGVTAGLERARVM